MFSYPSQVIIGDISPYTQAIATLNQTVFGTNWTANAGSDVFVYQTPFGQVPNDATQLLLTSQYSVAFIGSQEEVQVTLVTGAGIGDIITITRQTPASRENLYTNTNFLPTMLNQDFGILTLVDQQAQLVNQLIAPRYNYSAVITDIVDTILPILPPNYLWVKNSANSAIVAAPYNFNPGSGTVNPGAANDLAWYATSGTTVSGLPTLTNSVLTSPLGVPTWSNTVNLTDIIDANLNNLIGFVSIPSAVNSIIVSNSITGIAPTISANGNTGVGIQGTSTNLAPAAGNVGEVKKVTLPFASAIVLPNSTPTNVLSLPLSAGHWLVFGNALLNTTAGFGSTSGVLSTISGGGTPDLSNLLFINTFTASIFSYNFPVPCIEVLSSTPVTVYLVVGVTVPSGTATSSGSILAKRIS